MPFDPVKRVEMPDPRPLALPVGFEVPEPLHATVQRLVRTTISQNASLEGHETFEEANDFNTGEDEAEPLSDAERASEMGELLEASKAEILEAELQIKDELSKLEKKRKKLKALREKKEADTIEADDDDA